MQYISRGNAVVTAALARLDADRLRSIFAGKQLVIDFRMPQANEESGPTENREAQSDDAERGD